MSMLTAHFSNLCMTPAIVKKLLGFKVNPIDCSTSSPASTTGSTATLISSNTTNSNSNSPTSDLISMRSNSPLDQDSNSFNSFNSPIQSNLNSNQSLSNHNKLCEKAIRTLVKKLKKTPGALEELERAITTRDQMTKCIIIPTKSSTPQDRMQVSRKTLPHVVYCRIWRWPDLQNCNELKSVPHCQQGYNHHNLTNKNKTLDDSSVVCINPYHYIRCEPSSNSNSMQTSNNNQTSAQPLTVYVPKIATNQALQQQQQQTGIQPPVVPTFTTLTNSNTHQIPSCTNTTNTLSPNSNNNNNNLSPLSSTGTVSSSNTSSSSTSSINNQLDNNNLALGPHQQQQQQQQQQLSVTGDLIHSSYNMITASPSPISILSPSSIGSNAMSNQFSPFISEDDSSEINDISPSPMGPIDLMPVQMTEQPYWCSLSYYEMKQRVGEMFHVSANVHSVTIDGYTDPSSAQRFCLGVLSNVNRTNEVEMTRHYIGRGLMLSYENGQVFAECLSENPVFVQSPNCNQRYNWHLATVVKIPPGCSLKIFDEADFVQVANETVYQGYEAVYALTRICTIRISFVKGWGAEYRRQTILNTPCWIEVHLNNPLKLVDQILTKMGSPRTKCTSVS